MIFHFKHPPQKDKNILPPQIYSKKIVHNDIIYIYIELIAKDITVHIYWIHNAALHKSILNHFFPCSLGLGFWQKNGSGVSTPESASVYWQDIALENKVTRDSNVFVISTFRFAPAAQAGQVLSQQNEGISESVSRPVRLVDISRSAPVTHPWLPNVLEMIVRAQKQRQLTRSFKGLTGFSGSVAVETGDR